jgi:hypothetical protein
MESAFARGYYPIAIDPGLISTVYRHRERRQSECDSIASWML